jgi:hypothetical protein
MRAWLTVLAGFLVTGGLVAQPALGGTAQVRYAVDAKGRTAWVQYRADPGELNWVTSWISAADREGLVVSVRDADAPIHPARVSAGLGCTEDTSEGEPSRARCLVPQGSRLRGPELILGDGADKATQLQMENGVVRGGAGNDEIWARGLIDGGSGSDELDGHSTRDRILGGSGRDYIDAGGGTNLIVPGPGLDVVDADTGRGLMRTRDGQPDEITCEGRPRYRLMIDAHDFYLGGCGTVRRSGVARATALDLYYDTYSTGLMVKVGCPPDGPRVCVGRVAVRHDGRLIGTARFRSRHAEEPSILPIAAALNEGDVAEVTMSSRDRNGTRHVVRTRMRTGWLGM